MHVSVESRTCQSSVESQRRLAVPDPPKCQTILFVHVCVKASPAEGRRRLSHNNGRPAMPVGGGSGVQGVQEIQGVQVFSLVY